MSKIVSKPLKKEGIGARLCVELLDLIFSYLDPIDLGRCKQVNVHWSKVQWTSLDFSQVRNRIKYTARIYQSSGRQHLHELASRMKGRKLVLHVRILIVSPATSFRFMSESNGIAAQAIERPVPLLATLHVHKFLRELNISNCPKVLEYSSFMNAQLVYLDSSCRLSAFASAQEPSKASSWVPQECTKL